jgi:hypothetical protein
VSTDCVRGTGVTLVAFLKEKNRISMTQLRATCLKDCLFYISYIRLGKGQFDIGVVEYPD